MRLAVFSAKPYEEAALRAANGRFGHDLVFVEARLTAETAALARGFAGVCVFVNDRLDRPCLEALAAGGVRLVALRCAGYNNVDLAAAGGLGLAVVRVPAYSPHAVAEHAVALLLALNRKVHKAYNRVREGNFALDGLVGWDLAGKTAGVVGTGRIGRVLAGILRGLGMEVLAYDPAPDPALGPAYVPLDELYGRSDVVSLHCPLTPETHHMIDARAIERMKPGVTLVNTSRGGLVDTVALIRGLKSGRIGAVGLDVYEEEADVFFEDLSGRVIQDDVLARLMTFPNVIVTGHQAFLTREALAAIAGTTLESAASFEAGRPLENRVESPGRTG